LNMRQEESDPVFAGMRSEVAEWHPRRGPDLADLMLRADHSWLRPVIFASSVGAAALTVLLLLSMVMVVLAPAIPGGETIKAHLVAR
jgi:hypothetical protein